MLIDTQGGTANVINIGDSGLTNSIVDLLTVQSTGGTADVIIDNSADATDRTVSIGSGEIAGLTSVPIAYIGAGIASISILSGAGSDTFDVTPDTNTMFDVTGGSPTPPTSPGDQLNVMLGGATNPALTGALVGDGLQGTWSFGNRQSVSFSQIESLSPNVPTQISVVSGSGQSTAVGTSFASPLIVEVTDIFGDPVAGYDVTFTAPISGPSASLTAPAPTDANGRTQVSATANWLAGTYNVVATAVGASGNAPFVLTNTRIQQAPVAGGWGLLVLALVLSLTAWSTMRPRKN